MTEPVCVVRRRLLCAAACTHRAGVGLPTELWDAVLSFAPVGVRFLGYCAWEQPEQPQSDDTRTMDAAAAAAFPGAAAFGCRARAATHSEYVSRSIANLPTFFEAPRPGGRALRGWYEAFGLIFADSPMQPPRHGARAGRCGIDPGGALDGSVSAEGFGPGTRCVAAVAAL
eukprot:TRINITY_DN5969_c0_g1_i1.p2 TRINITY_DN5969_c0_g1~~TRINITY_DN5969_c0_g1_i1.p2  ORF type:complete len:196 (+),score=34.06 TRINITY_DN5969_c0_g1_i1:78-590(+)